MRHQRQHAVRSTPGPAIRDPVAVSAAALGRRSSGHDVLVPANTFFATAAVVAAGAAGSVDCDPATMVDPSAMSAPSDPRPSGSWSCTSAAS